tara:strand:+ start:1853 stop:2527 length:675 start_codon:yes stop_codon:yes gene_type:complete
MNQIKHVAIIMDGNGRWGIKHGKSRNFGHEKGIKTVEMVIKETIKKKIKFLTLFAFSTENWKRPRKEKNFLFKLLEFYIKDKLESLDKEKIKIKIIGQKIFTDKLNSLLNYAEYKTRTNKKLQINLALNYGSKNELLYTFNKLKTKKKKITIKDINNNLFTKNTPDPEVLIRTGNTKRLSNFLLWQIAYSEIFFEKKLWPDFTANDYNKILNKFIKTKRNFGNI